ncbi:MAG: sulfatase-like hydrolase/transferase [Verrucomicrobia bacterium]|nr:sulfatase-like hydrolase/transferase [Verrucomicrobiota bacterium]MCH8511614.1 sulfatase-like hydrolase/transferase [Kiritimatiellia bacterium]
MKSAPNILFITSDQQHYDTLGIDNPRIHTPNLDRLCREGTCFTRAYCPNPTCTPTRASLLTGLMPSHHGAWSLGTKLREDLPTLPGILSQAGYQTTLIGKAHFQPLVSTPEYPSIECQPLLRDLDFWRGFHGPWYGFDHIEITRNHCDEGHVGAHYAIWMEEKGIKNWADFFQLPDMGGDTERRQAYTHEDPRKWNLPAEMHYTSWTAERSIAAIDRAQSDQKPFFLWASFHDPHPPYIVSEPWASMYDPADMEPGRVASGEHDANPAIHRHAAEIDDLDFWLERAKDQGCIHGRGFHGGYPEEELRKDIACYYGMVSFMDEQIGRILYHLDARGLTENTLVVFTTDHGHFLGQHGLRLKAIHHYEDLLRVPFLARWPENIPADRKSEHLQNLVDLPRTFLKAVGMEAPVHMQGVNQLTSWNGEGPVREWSITENHHGYTRFHMHSFVTDRYKLTVHRDSDEGELFDLREDPGEQRNLWDDPGSLNLKAELLLAFHRARMAEEPVHMPRVGPA